MEVGLFIAGCITFPLLHSLSAKSLSRILPGKSEELYLAISTRVVSFLQAVCATCVGLHVVLKCENIMKDRFQSVNSYAWFGLSYFYYDLGAMFLETYHIYSHEKFLSICQKFFYKKYLVVLHHMFLPLFGFPIIVFFRRGIGDFFVACIYMAEMSTPFLSAHAIMGRLKWQRTIFYKVNGVMLAIAFFIGRILVFPFMYWSYAIHANLNIWDVPFRIPVLCNVACLGLLLLQSVWFLAILKRARRFLRSAKYPSPSANGEVLANDNSNGTVLSAINGNTGKACGGISRLAVEKHKM